METKSVVICGPPHSGKSVFVQQLRRKLLPTGGVAVIEGAPDGEGGWANVSDEAVVDSLRQKGEFTDIFVDWVLQSIEETTMPLALVDVGGLRSPENERIFDACDAYIVLASVEKEGELEAWNQFGQENGCEPVALLDSVLHGESQLEDDGSEDGIVRGVQAGLERGEKVDSPVIDAVCRRLKSLADLDQKPGEDQADVHFGRLADQVGIPEEERGPRLGFRPRHAHAVSALCREELTQQVCRIWGPAPGWLVSMLSAQATGGVELWDIRLGYVGLSELESGREEVLEWKLEETQEFNFLHFSIPMDVLGVEQLEDVRVPSFDSDKPIVLSGRGPHWLTAAIARHLERRGEEVAILAPNESSCKLSDGREWSSVYPESVPAVGISKSNLGELIPVPAKLI